MRWTMAVSTCDAEPIELHTKGIKYVQNYMWQHETGRGGKVRVDCRQRRLGQQVPIPGRKLSIA